VNSSSKLLTTSTRFSVSNQPNFLRNGPKLRRFPSRPLLLLLLPFLLLPLRQKLLKKERPQLLLKGKEKPSQREKFLLRLRLLLRNNLLPSKPPPLWLSNSMKRKSATAALLLKLNSTLHLMLSLLRLKNSSATLKLNFTKSTRTSWTGRKLNTTWSLTLTPCRRRLEMEVTTWISLTLRSVLNTFKESETLSFGLITKVKTRLLLITSRNLPT